MAHGGGRPKILRKPLLYPAELRDQSEMPFRHASDAAFRSAYIHAEWRSCKRRRQPNLAIWGTFSRRLAFIAFQSGASGRGSGAASGIRHARRKRGRCAGGVIISARRVSPRQRHGAATEPQRIALCASALTPVGGGYRDGMRSTLGAAAALLCAAAGRI